MGRYDTTVNVPLIVRNGRLEFLHSEKMPILREGAIGEVVLPVDAIKDSRWLEALNAKGKHELFPVDETLWVKLDLRSERQGSQDGKIGITRAQKANACWCDHHLDTTLPSGEVWTMIKLRSPLSLELRGEKKARLQGGKCFIPILDELQEISEAISLNQACTWLSQAFETWRHSHSGNAFTRVYVAQDDAQMTFDGQKRAVLIPLEQWRDREMAHHEAERLHSVDAVSGGSNSLFGCVESNNHNEKREDSSTRSYGK